MLHFALYTFVTGESITPGATGKKQLSGLFLTVLAAGIILAGAWTAVGAEPIATRHYFMARWGRYFMKNWTRAFALLAVAALGACTTVNTTAAGAVGIARQQSFLVSAEAVQSAAGEAYAKTLTEGRGKGALNNKPVMRARVQAISRRLIAQVGVFRPDAPGWKWEINVMDTPEINAWCMAGGKIMVYWGLIDKLKPTDAELAALLGHEIAHALREHTREAVSRSVGQQLVLAGLAAAAGASQSTVQIANAVAQVTYTLPHGRDQETEADRIGLELIARAGYEPRAAVTFFQKLARAAPSKGPSFLSTHPQSEARAVDLQSYIAKVQPLYDASAKP